MIESPTNPMQRICNIKDIAAVCHQFSALLSVDNTMMSPILLNPIKCGADIVVHSATKFVGGHSDTMAGVVISKEKETAEQIYFYQNAEGTGLAPFDAWLMLRGLKTMHVRIEKQQQNALQLATFLRDHPSVTVVYYAGLGTHKDYHIHSQQARGGGAVVCFRTGSLAFSQHIVSQTKLFKITVSFGSVNSLVSLPGAMSHASIPAEVRSAREFPEDLVRLAVGIENIDDLLNDLSLAFQTYESNAIPSESPVVEEDVMMLKKKI
jgi:cystathionine beta-lyase